MKYPILILFLVMFSGKTQAQTDTVGIEDMYILPAEPTSEDNIQLVIHAVLPQWPCQLDTSATEIVIVDNEINVITQYWTGLFASFCSITNVIELGYFSDGIYSLECNFANGVYTDTDSLTFIIGNPSSTSAHNAIEDEISLFPNPANDFINLAMSLADPADANLEIFDAQGKLAVNYNLGYKAFGEHTIALNLTNLSNGLFLMKISVGMHTVTKRFIKN